MYLCALIGSGTDLKHHRQMGPYVEKQLGLDDNCEDILKVFGT